jgi:hypothetical protein
LITPNTLEDFTDGQDGIELLSDSGYSAGAFYVVRWIAPIYLLEKQPTWNPLNSKSAPLQVDEALDIATKNIASEIKNLTDIFVASIQVQNLTDKDDILERSEGYWFYVITFHPRDKTVRKDLLQSGKGWMLTSVILMDGTTIQAIDSTK